MVRKLCNDCKKTKSIKDFTKEKNYCKICYNKKMREYRNKNRDKINAYERKRCRTRKIENKVKIFNAYGGYKCVCCGIEDKDILTIDHINGNGNKHRKLLKKRGTSFYMWLKRNNYPPGYQVLCFNCNWKKHIVELRKI